MKFVSKFMTPNEPIDEEDSSIESSDFETID